MNKRRSHFLLIIYAVLIAEIFGCQRETPAEKTGSQNNQSTGAVEQAAQQAVDAIKTPMDKARGVDDTLGKAAGRTADKVKETTQ
jgi:hypothetical protein